MHANLLMHSLFCLINLIHHLKHDKLRYVPMSKGDVGDLNYEIPNVFQMSDTSITRYYGLAVYWLSSFKFLIYYLKKEKKSGGGVVYSCIFSKHLGR